MSTLINDKKKIHLRVIIVPLPVEMLVNVFRPLLALLKRFPYGRKQEESKGSIYTLDMMYGIWRHKRRSNLYIDSYAIQTS